MRPALAPDRALLGIFLMTVFALFGPVIDVFAKLASETIPVGQAVAARFAVQSLLLLPVAAALGGLHRPGRAEVIRHFLRAALILLATGCFFAALAVMPMADAIAIFFVEPFILTLLGGVLLGEAVGWRRYLACAVGFGGALLIIKPSFSDFGAVAFLPLGTAVCFAFYMILTRRMAVAMHPLTLQAYTAVAAMALILPVLGYGNAGGLAPIDPVWPDLRSGLYLLGIGVAATVAHLFISFALKFAPAATIAPLQYIEIVSATLLGFWVFGDFPDLLTMLGIAIIVGSGLFVYLRERRLSRRARLPMPPP
ncbi:EamA family transporter [Maritimibacter sp. 55A14]|nr:EamA family transporter [Maritimibacter sp. 55A14]